MRTSRLAEANIGAPKPSDVVAHYLEAIYYIRAEGEVVRSARLADWLGVSRPTVTAALRRMTRDGMVRLTGKKEIELRPRGETAAAAIVRRHRIIERWLTDALNLDWVTADTEAERLETALSDQLANKLHESLGKPQTCPHGNPIPGSVDNARSYLKDRGAVRLSSLAIDEQATILCISEVVEDEEALILYLHEKGLTPDTQLRVLAPDDAIEEEQEEAFRVQVEGREVCISKAVAGKIWVTH